MGLSRIYLAVHMSSKILDANGTFYSTLKIYLLTFNVFEQIQLSVVHAGPSKLGSWFRMTSSSFKLIYVLGLVPVCSLCTLLGHARFLLVAAYLPICSSFLVVANRHQIWCEMLSEINSVFLAIRHESCATSHLALSYYQSYYIGKFSNVITLASPIGWMR